MVRIGCAKGEFLSAAYTIRYPLFGFEYSIVGTVFLDLDASVSGLPLKRLLSLQSFGRRRTGLQLNVSNAGDVVDKDRCTCVPLECQASHHLRNEPWGWKCYLVHGHLLPWIFGVIVWWVCPRRLVPPRALLRASK